mmetsp:Transcript_30521/g.73673  ORF Transcript_30521/g.73673 Transcript_30521/m.73673 type:complete len:242 (+) Transcript_30521:750-1475(+)
MSQQPEQSRLGDDVPQDHDAVGAPARQSSHAAADVIVEFDHLDRRGSVSVQHEGLLARELVAIAEEIAGAVEQRVRQPVPFGVVDARGGCETRHLLGIERKDADGSVRPAGGNLDVPPSFVFVVVAGRSASVHVETHDLARVQSPSRADAAAQHLPVTDLQRRLAPSQIVPHELRSSEGEEGRLGRRRCGRRAIVIRALVCEECQYGRRVRHRRRRAGGAREGECVGAFVSEVGGLHLSGV